jgi:peptidoglycan/xylan/chitin deacetylase (PgdA/CDA1 family)
MKQPLAWFRRKTRDVALARAIMLRVHALRKPTATRQGGILFLFYHDVRADEQDCFYRQLQMFRSLGEFVGIDEALCLIKTGGANAKDRICLTFDDGYRGAFDYAAPILFEGKIPAAFFVVPHWIDEQRQGIASWGDCRRLVSLGMVIGSHCLTHTRLNLLHTTLVTEELVLSKNRIETELGLPCLHFACPWGQPGADYQPDREPALARGAGYQSFFTTVPRRAYEGSDFWALPRVRMEPSWGIREVRYAFSRSQT